ncbi:MAG: sulfatase [Planctomycetaceae bacterium]|nr:sulfatase [Planctomycetaceae bacterium]
MKNQILKINWPQAISVAVLSLIVSLPTAASASDRPNILWIVVDDMSANFSCYGEDLIQTPAVDQLAAEGVRFTNAFVTAPVCSPCRSAFITGMYQTSIGAHHHRSGRGELRIHLPEGIEVVPAIFQRAGYYTCIGNGLKANKPASRKKKPGAGLGKTDYNFEWDTSVYDDNDWEGRGADQPFFMQVQLAGGKLRGGNSTAAASLQQKAEEEFGGCIDSESVTLPPYYPRDPVLLQDWAAYLDTVRFTDQHVGKVIQRLRDEGILDQTLIIFMTDHGISHARGKQFLYNEGTHVPFIVRGPGIPAGRVRDDLIEHIDMAAISLGAAGLDVPAWMQGQDVFSTEYQTRTAVFAARDRCDETVDYIRSVRTNDYLYIRNFLPQRPHLQPNAYKDGKSIIQTLRRLHSNGELSELSERLLFSEERPVEELYAWKQDRWNLINLAGSPMHADALKNLRERLEQWQMDTNDHGPESMAMYDSDMSVYTTARVAKGLNQNSNEEDITLKNIRLMKKWASEGK